MNEESRECRVHNKTSSLLTITNMHSTVERVWTKKIIGIHEWQIGINSPPVRRWIWRIDLCVEIFQKFYNWAATWCDITNPTIVYDAMMVTVKSEHWKFKPRTSIHAFWSTNNMMTVRIENYTGLSPIQWSFFEYDEQENSSLRC